MHDTITGPVFQEMLIFGAASIAKEKQSINDLNVFPVPDGDTGTNMSLTMHAAAQELQKRSPATVDLASSITASALLRGARGNSGVILSLLFRGMSKSLKGCVTADGCTFAAAMQEGVSAAYNAVMKPAEGTILTVSRLAADRAMAASAEKNSVEYVIEQAISQGEETLRQTVDMNPVLKKAGVDGSQIKTWDDYYEAAKKVKAIGAYMTNNSGSSMEYQPFTAQAWQAGAQPWKVDGENITIDMTKDSGMKKYIEFQQKLIDEDLVDTKIANWSDDWNRALNEGDIATLTIGAWMPVNLMNGAPDQAGNWRVAQLPQWNEGDEVSAEDGGSALAVVSQSKQQAAAYKFVEYLTHGDGAQTMADTGTFPSLKKILSSDSFTDPNTEANKKVNDYFGGQNVNEILSEAAQRKVSAFQYLPYNPYAQSTFGDQISKAYSEDITLEEAFVNYSKALTDHGNQQGYTVTSKD